jgi:O-antigen/teichoic acid export membrane protein
MKSLFKNSLYNIIYKLINVIFPLITTIYISRCLGTEGIGKVTTAQNIVSYFLIIASLGLPIYGTKIIAENRSNNNLSKVYSELFSINFISTVICTLLYLLLIFTISSFYEKLNLFFAVGVSLIFNILNVDWFYQGIEEYKYIMIRSIVVKVIALGLVLFFVKTRGDIIQYALIQSSAIVLNYIFNILHIRKYVKFTTKNISLKYHMKPLLILLATSISIEIYTLVDTTMLSFIHEDSTVGLYTTAVKCINIVKSLVYASCAVFLPRLSCYYKSKEYKNYYNLIEKGIKILLIISVFSCAFIIGFSDRIIQILFGNEFKSASITMSILAISIISVTISGFLGNQILTTLGKEKYVFLSTLSGAVLNIFFNLILIPILAQNGAAIASIITELIITIIQIIMVKKYIYLKISFCFIISLIVGGVGVILIALIPVISSVQLVDLILKGIISGIIYILIELILGNKFIREKIKK